MGISLLLARLALAAVFAVAAIGKLTDRAGSRASAEAFGVPRRLARTAAVVLPACEVAVAVALLTSGGARFGALAGAVLLALFTAAIARTMARGAAPDCHCFGQLSTKPVGRATLARNAVLGAAAGAIAIAGWSEPGPSAVAWLGRLPATGVAMLCVGLGVAVLGGLGLVAFVSLLRAHGRLLVRVDDLEARLTAGHERPDDPAGGWRSPDDLAGGRWSAEDLAVGGLAVGTAAPAFALGGLDGGTTTLAGLIAVERPVLLVFTDPECGPCEDLLADVAAWQERHARALTIAPISRGSERENRAGADQHGVSGVLLDHDLDAYGSYEVNGTPSAVLVDPAGRIAAPAAGGAAEITALVEAAIARYGPPRPLDPRPDAPVGPDLIGSRSRPR